MPTKHILLAILVSLIWGCNFIFVKLGVHEIPPLFLCALRFFLASIPAVFFIPRPASSFKMVVLYGFVMFVLQFSLIFTGMAMGMTAGMAALLAQTQIFFSVFFAAIFIREIPTFWQILGGLLSFSGIGIAFMHLDSNMTLAGFMFVMAGAIAWGFGNLITKKIHHVNMIALVIWGSLISFLPLLILSLLLEGPERIGYALHHFSSIAVISLLYIVYLSTWVGYGAWNYLLSRYQVSAVAPFTLLVPIFAMGASALFLGEHFEGWKFLVAGLVIAGLCVNLILPKIWKAYQLNDV